MFYLSFAAMLGSGYFKIQRVDKRVLEENPNFAITPLLLGNCT